MIEDARLSALASYDILDTLPEQGFDDIVELAREICEASVALVSLVAADRQWFKARAGFHLCETPIEQSVCAHALHEPRLLIITDLTLDERTRDNTLVTGEPHIRFYAGAPLTTSEGLALGTLCVIDGRPRPEGLTERQQASLERLARQVMAQMELRRAIAARDAADRAQRVLNEELSHRLKNTLAMVQAIAAQTLRGVTERDAVAAFDKRLHAIAAAHDVLLQQSWSSAKIADVAAAVLSLFDSGSRFEIAGPDLALSPRATLSLSLLLHELATNALKYGALSVNEGRAAVTWRVERPDDNLVLSWSERGGPPTREPERKGFGSRLIKMGLVGAGGADLRYRPPGFEADFRAPLAQVQQS